MLASAYLASNHVVSVLQPALDRVVEGSAGNLVDGDPRRRRRGLHRARQSDADILRGLDIGYRLPAFCTSVGRVLLSRLTDNELAQALGRWTSRR